MTYYKRGKDYDLALVLEDISSGFRVCTRCNEKKEISEFSKRTAHITGYKSWCKECDSKAFKKWRYENIEQVRSDDRSKHYARKYKVDEETSKFLGNPDNRIQECPICKQIDRLVMDHDHSTGKIRGLICSACNSVLGYSKESIDTLYEAIVYIKRHRGY